jgi:clan AA aspartic protease (TIGR02281 family)
MRHEFLIDKRKIIVFTTIKGINDTREFKFILDTGSSKTIINEKVAFSLGYDLKRLENGEKLMTAGGSMHSKILRLPKLSLFGKDMVNFEVSVLNLPLQITYFADGLIGMDFLLQFKNIKFDFENKIIET